MGYIFDIHLAKTYENWCRSPKGLRMESFIEKMISETLKPFKQERVLDIGCGSGTHLLYANKSGMNITGIDASPYMLDLARGRLGNRCELKRAHAEDIPYEDNEFDIVFLINTLELLDNPVQALKEAGRVAKRKIVIVFFNSMSGYCCWQKLYGMFSNTLFSYLRPRSLWEIKKLTNTAYGSVPIEWQSEYLFPQLFKKFELSVINPCKYLPFGYLIGMTVTLKYHYKTDNLLIKKELGRSKSPVPEGINISNNQ